jgi:pimeloyl-ACP methyl ester carboxylesterase
MPTKRKNTNAARSGASGGALLAGAAFAAVGGWIAYSQLAINHDWPLPSAINAERHGFAGNYTGMLNYYADIRGAGRPLVLIHSVNAAASAYEMRPLFERFRGSRPVYALDLPGFGHSERADRIYSPQLFTQAVLDMLKLTGQADVVALSLGSEFAARTALERPDLFHSLTMISPSGFTAKDERGVSQSASDNGASDFAHGLLSAPLWSQAFYDLLTTKRSIGWFLSMSFVGTVDVGLATYAYLTSHQPGARYAPLYFVSGKLFTPDIAANVYERLTIPVQVVYDQDAFVNFDLLPGVVERNPNWQSQRITPTKGLPHFEQTDAVIDALRRFWDKLG